MINIDKVYKTVLFLMNKEGRGYVTPDEFNSIAEQVQLDIFNEYLSLGRRREAVEAANQDTESPFFSRVDDIDSLLLPFVSNKPNWGLLPNTNSWAQSDQATRKVIKVGAVYASYDSLGTSSVCERLTRKDYELIIRSNMMLPDEYNPAYHLISQGVSISSESTLLINVYPKPQSITVDGLYLPQIPKWAFTVNDTYGYYEYDEDNSTNFDLIDSEQNKVIIGILKYCGLVINDLQVVQLASQQEQLASQKENN